MPAIVAALQGLLNLGGTTDKHTRKAMEQDNV